MNRAKRGPRPAVRGTAALGLAILLGFMCAPRISSAQSPAKDVPAAPQASGAPSVPAAPQSASATPAGPTAAERFKNIQVLKDIPADSLIPSMNFISASLGVECAFCHVNPFDKDEKQEKATAREMITMTMAINKDNFKGHREVTCNTCHRGASKPVAIPLFMEASATAPAPEKAANPPSAIGIHAQSGSDRREIHAIDWRFGCRKQTCDAHRSSDSRRRKAQRDADGFIQGARQSSFRIAHFARRFHGRH